jgi:hypothetical protein
VGQTLISDYLIPARNFIDLKAKIEEIDVLFVFGVGDSSLHRPLSQWLKKEDDRFLVFIEGQEERFLEAKKLPIAGHSNVRILYWKRGDEEIFRRTAWEFVFLRFGFALSDPSLNEEAQEFFVTLEHYHRGVDLLASDNEDMGVKVLKNALHNLSALSKARLGTSLEGKCAQIPAIVCGAGPSLNQAAPHLAALKDKALIIAGGSSVRALNAHGINPHLFAAIDPHPPYRRFLEQDCFEIPFFYQGRFCHSLLERVQSPLLFMPDGGSYPLEAWMAAEMGIFAERFDGGWTVSNFCTSVAAHLGCNPIIFVGMDFSCGPDAIYAAQMAGEENRQALIELEKDKLYSKRDWLMSAEWTVSFAKKYPHIHWIHGSHGGTHDGSMSGIDLPGIERREISELAQSMLTTERDMPGIVHSLVSDARASQVSFEKIAHVRKKIKESFEKSLEICERLLTVWEKHFPNSPLEKGEYILLDVELEEQICHRHFLLPLWNVWKHPMLRSSFHPLGSHIQRLLFFKKAIEMHLPYLRSFS